MTAGDVLEISATVGCSERTVYRVVDEVKRWLDEWNAQDDAGSQCPAIIPSGAMFSAKRQRHARMGVVRDSSDPRAPQLRWQTTIRQEHA